MRLFVTTFLLLAGLFHGLSFGAGYKVTKVIEAGSLTACCEPLCVVF